MMAAIGRGNRVRERQLVHGLLYRRPVGASNLLALPERVEERRERVRVLLGPRLGHDVPADGKVSRRALVEVGQFAQAVLHRIGAAGRLGEARLVADRDRAHARFVFSRPPAAGEPLAPVHPALSTTSSPAPATHSTARNMRPTRPPGSQVQKRAERFEVISLI
jgi:hypothetical protein